MVLNRFQEAGPFMEEAHRLAEAAGSQEVLAATETLQGSRLIRVGQWSEAETALQSAVGRARSLRSGYQEAGAMVNLGMSRVLRHRYDEAAGFFEKAAAAAGPDARTLTSAARTNLATCYSRLGEFDRAIALQQEAVTQHERSGARLYLEQALGEIGNTYML